MKRRDLLKAGLAIGVAASRRVSAAARAAAARGSAVRGAAAARPVVKQSQQTQREDASGAPTADYIVVGSGAGGGTVAARLAEAGYTVLVLEAGGDPKASHPENYEVPAFHPRATEDEAIRWDFFVRHYKDQAQQRRDSNYLETWNGKRVDGVWYPRAGTLGGCTAHNAMIFTCPSDTDWNQLADLTGDPSWRADAMRGYFERVERCRHRPFERLKHAFGLNPSRHGWSGWLQTEKAIPDTVFGDSNLLAVLLKSASEAFEATRPQSIGLARLQAQLDPNDWRVAGSDEIGVRYTPLATERHQRVGARERVLDVRDRYPHRLKVALNALATRVIFEGRRAVGVEYLQGERLYSAHARPSDRAGELEQAFAAREVILAGGAFNTPQLLMLSGVGPPDVLGRVGIPVRIPLEGVGSNLQDRYEISVVNEMNFPAWELLRGATFRKGDEPYKRWERERQGVYITNGAVVSVILRSGLDRPVPDLFCYALLADFRGYHPHYSDVVAERLNYLSWIVLKAHTNNTAGCVALRSSNPRDTPQIDFHYFEESNDAAGDDLRSVVEGIKFVRRISQGIRQKSLIKQEVLPGAQRDTDDKLKEYVRDNAWGHHACGTCAIGDPAKGGVLTSDFKVHGAERLRVVDASVFPRIPGHFIVSAVYMIGEKAADVIIEDAKRQR